MWPTLTMAKISFGWDSTSDGLRGITAGMQEQVSRFSGREVHILWTEYPT